MQIRMRPTCQDNKVRNFDCCMLTVELSTLRFFPPPLTRRTLQDSYSTTFWQNSRKAASVAAALFLYCHFRE